MLNLYFHFLQFFLKIQNCEKSVKDVAPGNNQN